MALNKNAANISLALNKKPLALPLPAAFAPSPAEIATGYDIKNTSPQNLWRSFTLTGAPKIALPAIAQGYTLTKSYYNLDGTKLDPAHLKQNDRLIVALTGQVNDDDDHRTVIVELLPAGWEIDAPITDDSSDYGFLGPLSQTRVVEALAEISPRCKDEPLGIFRGAKCLFSRATLGSVHPASQHNDIPRRALKRSCEIFEMVAPLGEHKWISPGFERCEDVVNDKGIAPFVLRQRGKDCGHRCAGQPQFFR